MWPTCCQTSQCPPPSRRASSWPSPPTGPRCPSPLKKNFKVKVGDKYLGHQTSLKILGNIFTEDLSWEKHVQSVVIPSLANRAWTLAHTANFMSPRFRQIFATAIFKGKLNFAIEAWGALPKPYCPKLKKYRTGCPNPQLDIGAQKCHFIKEKKYLDWLSIRDEIKLSTLRMTHKIVHLGIPEELASRMPLNTRNPRLIEAHKLNTKPKLLTKNKQMSTSFRSRAYIFNTLPNRLSAIVKPKRFNRWLKIYLRDPSKLPKVIPTLSQSKPKPKQIKNRHKKPITSQITQHPPNQTIASQDRIASIEKVYQHFKGLNALIPNQTHTPPDQINGIATPRRLAKPNQIPNWTPQTLNPFFQPTLDPDPDPVYNPNQDQDQPVAKGD